MKINLLKILLPFLLTFFVAVTVVSLAGYFGFGKFGANSYDLETKQKIYAVLVKDQENSRQRIEKYMEAIRKKGDMSNLANYVDPMVFKRDPDITNRLVIDLAKATHEIDISQSPDEFQRAWRKYANARTRLVEVGLNMPPPSELKSDSIEAKNRNDAVSEQIQAWSEVVSIAKSYGIKFDQYDNFIIETLSEN